MRGLFNNSIEPHDFGGINFYVSINHHKNHSWQGYIEWLDSGEKVHFRSELELMNLMSQAVASRQKDNEQLRNWLLTE